MLRNRSLRRGFTLLELLIVVCVIVVLIALLLPALAKARAATRRNAAKATMNTIVMALEKYRDDFKYYPPENLLGTTSIDPTLSDSGSKVLAYYLCQKFADGEMHLGPYMDLSTARLIGGDKMVSILGGFYRYKVFTDANGLPQSYPGRGSRRGTNGSGSTATCNLTTPTPTGMASPTIKTTSTAATRVNKIVNDGMNRISNRIFNRIFALRAHRDICIC